MATSATKTQTQAPEQPVRAKAERAEKRRWSAPDHELRRGSSFFSNTGYSFGDIDVRPPSSRSILLGQPGDRYEQEADRISKRGVRMQASWGEGTAPVRATSLPIHGERISMNLPRQGGKSLDESTRTEMESSFGQSFANVRVHHDRAAHQQSEAMAARAFTVGEHIYFSRGEYNPASSSGQSLLAHELTHVVQQGQMGGDMLQCDENDKKKKKLEDENKKIKEELEEKRKEKTNKEELEAINKENKNLEIELGGGLEKKELEELEELEGKKEEKLKELEQKKLKELEQKKLNFKAVQEQKQEKEKNIWMAQQRKAAGEKSEEGDKELLKEAKTAERDKQYEEKLKADQEQEEAEEKKKGSKRYRLKEWGKKKYEREGKRGSTLRGLGMLGKGLGSALGLKQKEKPKEAPKEKDMAEKMAEMMKTMKEGGMMGGGNKGGNPMQMMMMMMMMKMMG